MGGLFERIADWIKEGLLEAITGQYTSIFESVNNQVGDVAQNVVGQSAGVINGNLDVTAALSDLETQLEAMGMWELIGLSEKSSVTRLQKKN